MAKLIQRITVVRTMQGPQGEERVATELYRATPKRRPKWARQMEKLQRRRLVARKTYWSELLRGHDDANRKRTWGSVIKRGRITARAMRKAMKTLRKR